VEQDMPSILAFPFSHTADAPGEIENHLVTLDTIEALTGFDFFRDLSDDIEDPLESESTRKNWDDFGVVPFQ
jgi:endonuclease G, mitochondrial